MRLLAGGELGEQEPFRPDPLVERPVRRRVYHAEAVAEDADRGAAGIEHGRVGDGIAAPRHPAHDRDLGAGAGRGHPLGDVDAVLGGVTGADDGGHLSNAALRGPFLRERRDRRTFFRRRRSLCSCKVPSFAALRTGSIRSGRFPKKSRSPPTKQHHGRIRDLPKHCRIVLIGEQRDACTEFLERLERPRPGGPSSSLLDRGRAGAGNAGHGA